MLTLSISLFLYVKYMNRSEAMSTTIFRYLIYSFPTFPFYYAMYLSFLPSFLSSIDPSIYPSTYPSIHPSTYPSIHQFTHQSNSPSSPFPSKINFTVIFFGFLLSFEEKSSRIKFSLHFVIRNP